MDGVDYPAGLDGYAGKPSRLQFTGITRKRHNVVGPRIGVAGVETGRITELALHTRKRMDWSQRDGKNLRDLACAAGNDPAVPRGHKKSQLRYCGLDPVEQRAHFQTRWKPVDGKMAFCTGRREGCATVECDYEYIDRHHTYHTWKRMGDMNRHYGSNLQYDRFLTVEEGAKRSDRLPTVRNRNPPIANADGPFEKPRKGGGNLDRTFTPREDAARRDAFKTSSQKPTNNALKSSHLQLSTLINETGPDALEKKCGVRHN